MKPSDPRPGVPPPRPRIAPPPVRQTVGPGEIPHVHPPTVMIPVVTRKR